MNGNSAFSGAALFVDREGLYDAAGAAAEHCESGNILTSARFASKRVHAGRHLIDREGHYNSAGAPMAASGRCERLDILMPLKGKRSGAADGEGEFDSRRHAAEHSFVNVENWKGDW